MPYARAGRVRGAARAISGVRRRLGTGWSRHGRLHLQWLELLSISRLDAVPPHVPAFEWTIAALRAHP